MRLKNPSRALILLIAILIPVLAAGAFSATLARPGEHIRDVVAAVVNNDEPVELEGQLVPLGRQLGAALVEGDGLAEVDGQSQNYTWVMTNDELAAEGLRSGEYTAVVTIPAEFSAAATSTADPDGQIDQALIRVTTSPRARLADEAMTNTIIRAALASLGHELTGTYLDNIFLGFNTMGDELGVAAEGAQSLAAGAKELSSGMGEIAGATTEISDGAGQLAAGTGELAGGAGQLAAGAGELASGTRDLAGGAGELAGGLGELAGGLGDFAQGTSQFADGVGGLAAGTRELHAGTEQLADGADELAAGAGEYAAGMDQFTDGMGQLAGGAGELAGGLNELNDAVAVVPEYLDQIEHGLADGVDGIKDFAGQVGGAKGDIEELVTQVCAADPDGEACRILLEYVGDSEALDNILTQIQGGLYELAGWLENAGADDGMLGQIQQLFTGIDQLAGGAGELAGGLDEAHGGAQELSAAAGALAEGNQELAEGIRALSTGVGELDSGAGELAAGARDISRGAGSLAGAGGQIAGGAGKLADGAGQLADGTGELASGAGDLASGAAELSGGAGELSHGLDQLADGAGQLADGTGELVEGTEEFADGLGQATDEIPSYPDGTRQTLAETIADPMAIDGDGPVNFRWLAFFAVIALWAGGLWLLAAYPAVASNAGASTRTAVSLTWRSLRTPALVALVQGVTVAVLVGAFANVSAGSAVGFGALAVLASIVFMTVQRGAVALWGWVGVALTVLIGIFTLATALLSAMPAYATTLLGWLPVGPAISATQGLEISGGAVVVPVLGLLAWGGAGVLAIIAATRREVTR